MCNKQNLSNNNLKLNLIYLVLMFCCIGATAQQTYSIRGTVMDENGTLLSGATVFITNSRYITIADSKGQFIFNNIYSGSYEVVVKMIGYLPVVENIVVHEKPVNLSVHLGASNTMLNAVVIRGRPDPKRDDYLEQFTRNFLGETVNAEQCKIVNPDVLNFHYDKITNVLTATADDFIVVENKALGYRLKYLLTQFEFDSNNYICAIVGSPYFEELKGTEAQQKKWDINRRVAYLSSSRHFFRAVMNNTVKDEDYIVYQVINDSKVINELKSRSPADIIEYYQTLGFARIKRYAMKISAINSLFTDGGKNFKTLKNDGARLGLLIAYTGQDQSPLFYKTGAPYDLPLPLSARVRRNMQVSQLTSLIDTVTIDINYTWPSKGFRYSGYWSWLRIADLIPLDYFVDPVDEKKQ